MSLSRREFLKRSSLIFAGTALAACGAPAATPTETQAPAASEAQPQPQQPAAQQPAKEKIQMVYHTWTVPPESNGEQVGVNKFMEENPDVEVEFRQTPFAEYWKALLTDAGIGQPPDAYLMNNFFWQQYINAGMATDLTPTAVLLDTPGTDLEAYIPSVLEAAKRDGKLYGFPKAINGSAFIINKTLFAEAGVEEPPESPTDWTWDEFREKARALTDPERKIFGAWIQEGPHWTPTFLYTLGGRFLDPETHSRAEGWLNSDANAIWVQWVKDMTDEGILPAPGGLDAFGGSTGAMLGGNIAITHTDGFHQVAFAKRAEAPYEWGGAKNPIPDKDTELKPHIAIHGTMVPKGVKDVMLATQLAGYAAWGAGTEMDNPTKLSPRIEFAEKQALEAYPYFRPLLDQCFAPNVELHEGALITHMDILVEEWSDMMERVLLEGMSPKESLDIAAKNYDKRVAEKES